MAYGRSGHTATLLQNGKVLVVGTGEDGNFPAEIYDPASGLWSTTGTVTDPLRVQHTATLLPNGKVLVAGGYWTNAMAAETAELYDPATGTFTKTANLITRRASHTATLLPNGKVLVAGGFWQDVFAEPESIAKVEIYDPAGGGWSATGDMTNKRRGHTATLLPNGKVLVAGGFDFDGHNPPVTWATAELYDPATGTWSATGSLSRPRSGHGAVLLKSGKVLVVGGDATGLSAELYDPASGTWTTTGSLTAASAGYTATLLPSNQVLVEGGTTGNNGNYVYLATAQLYDPGTATWRSTGSLLQMRSGHTATLLPNNKVLISGGGNSNSFMAPKLSSAELYTPPLTPPDLHNISTRLPVQTGDKAMIGGFIITGTESKTVVLRGIGPSTGMPGALQDPVIELHGSSGELVATNDNWKDTPNKEQIIDSGLAPANELESALWQVLNPGTYTVVVRGKNDASGLGLFEVYDLAQTSDSKLGNVSTRGPVQTGNDVMIAGIIVGGGSDHAFAKVMVRGIGPSIPVAGALVDPTVELRDASGALILFNDNWKMRSDGTSQQAEIEATTTPPSKDSESALVQLLAPGQYTAILRGQGNTSGVGLVEVYNLR